jgi:peptidoglycan-associated lipoprotein
MSLLRALRPSLLLLLTPFLFAAHCKKKDEVVENPNVDIVANPEVRLQVVSVEPDSVEPDAAFRAIVYGSGFAQGARVWFGATEIAAVTFRDENTLTMSAPPMPAGIHDVKVQNPNGEISILRAGLRARKELSQTDPAAGLSCHVIRIPFDFDKNSISGEAERELNRHLPCFTSRTSPVRIEGHCDERGTTEYNLALGLRRAESVQKWLVNHNVPPSRLRTVSYGEERPVDGSHNEAAWAKNRRADISVQ